MKKLSVNGLELNYVERGSGDETVVFSHSFLVDHRQFDAQIAALEGRYRVIAYDHRDHGGSSRARAAYGLDEIVSDAIGVIEATRTAPCRPHCRDTWPRRSRVRAWRSSRAAGI